MKDYFLKEKSLQDISCKLVRAVENDADFVISSSSAYKGTTELERAKSSKTSEKSEVFLYIALAFN